jgi:hypothetical protein
LKQLLELDGAREKAEQVENSDSECREKRNGVGHFDPYSLIWKSRFRENDLLQFFGVLPRPFPEGLPVVLG